MVGGLTLILTTLSKTDEYEVSWEAEGPHFHVHCHVYVWKPSVLKALYGEIVKVCDLALSMGHSRVYSCTTNKKFCQMLGAETGMEIFKGYTVMYWKTGDEYGT